MESQPNSYTIEPGERIAQLVIVPILRAHFEVVDEFEQTKRGTADLAAQENNNKDKNSYQIPAQFRRTIFRAYDIRGPVDAKHLTPDVAYAIGLAVGAEAKDRGEHTIIVGSRRPVVRPGIAFSVMRGFTSQWAKYC